MILIPKHILLSLLALVAAGKEPYSPITATAGDPTVVELRVEPGRGDRALPLRVYLPAGEEAAPVILFSHGLGGSRSGSSYLGRHWAGRGFAVVYLQHPGSDDSVWKELPPQERMEALRAAASGRSFLDRVRDVGTVLDALEGWNRESGHALSGRLDLERVGMSGHSFGALTTQAVSGQAIGGRTHSRLAARGQASSRRAPPFRDDRIRAAIALSPSIPQRGDPEEAFASVSLPWMLMTGTHDTSPIGNRGVESRLAVFPALPPGDKYEVVLNGAEHSAFTERRLPGDEKPKNPNHHRAILALSTAFWETYLKNDPRARSWLHGDAPRSVLEEGDRWQKK